MKVKVLIEERLFYEVIVEAETLNRYDPAIQNAVLSGGWGEPFEGDVQIYDIVEVK
jgi:hypothetical protein